VKRLSFGIPQGKTVIYFHGAPGSPEECAIFDEYAKVNELNVICYDRFSIDPSLHGKDYYKHLASAIMDETNGVQVDIIGFSIGCHAAIESSFYLDGKVRNLHLISPAAPLDGTNFLKGMAGESVFTMAIKYPIIFTLLSNWQALLAKIAPAALLKILFLSAVGQDKILSKTLDFKRFIRPVLIHCFGRNLKGYIREIKHYVEPWQVSVRKCTANTHIWHGADDNWSPVSMANYLKTNMANVLNLEIMGGISHYSCLYLAAPKICKQLASA
jgi:pimeloyl-ACP methyl ester carboxylesterase